MLRALLLVALVMPVVVVMVGCSPDDNCECDAPTVTLTASETTVNVGETVTLTWASTNAGSVVGTNFGATTVSGTKAVTVTATTTYSITVHGSGGEQTATVTVTVGAAEAPTVTLVADPDWLMWPDSSQLTWTSTNATTVVASNFGATSVSGTLAVNPEIGSNTYSITVSGPGGEQTATADVYAQDVILPPPPEVYLDALPSTIFEGESVTLTWSSNNANSVSSDFGATDLSGAMTLWPVGTTTYTIWAAGPGGPDAYASVTVTVLPPG
jgi:PKD repeat protein